MVYGDRLYMLCLVVPIWWFPVVWGYLIPVSSVVLWFLLLTLVGIAEVIIKEGGGVRFPDAFPGFL